MAATGSGSRRGVAGSLVFRSKLRPPSAERLLPRPRLLEMLDASSTKPLIVVISPAGTGKTSLLASWVSSSPRPVAWLSVDEIDHDPKQFWTGVISALGLLVDEVAPRAMTLLQRPGALDAAVAAVLDALEAQERPPSTLLIDDVHLVDDNPETVASLALFIQHLPRWLQVILIARRAPDLPLARLRARGQLCEISYSDLLFSDDEAAELLSSLAPSMDAGSIQEVVIRADGWAAGIQLAALAARSSHSPRQVVPRDRESLLVSEFMWQDVLANEPTELVDALLDISLAGRVSTSLAECMTGRADTGRLLSLAESRGLFVSRLGSSDWFEVHSLVRERLREELLARSPDRVAELHTRAAMWFERADEVATALDHWILAGQPREALRLLAAKCTTLYDTGREATIARALVRLPAAAYFGDLEAAIDLAWCSLLVDADQFLREVDQARACAEHIPEIAPAVRGRLTLLHSIAETIRGDWSSGGRLARQALEDFGDTGWSRDLLGRVGWNMIARDIALSERWQVSAETQTLRNELSRDAERRLAFEGTHALGRALAGEPLDALRVAAGVREIALVSGLSILRLELAAAEAIAHRELGERRLAMSELTALCTGPSGPVSYAPVLAQLELTQMYVDEGCRGEAATCFGQAIDLVESSFGGRGGRNWLGRVGTQLALANGDLDQAQHWSCTIDDAFWAPVSRARVELASDHRRQALDSLDDAVARCVRHEVVLDLIRSRALVNHDEAVNLAGSAAERAARVGLVQSVASEGADCLRLIELVAWRVPESWLAQVRRAPTGGGPGPVPARRLVESLTDREHEVLRLLPTRLTLHEIADELFISMNTLKFHLKVIYRKLGCGSRAEAADAARELAHSHGSGQPSAILRR